MTDIITLVMQAAKEYSAVYSPLAKQHGFSISSGVGTGKEPYIAVRLEGLLPPLEKRGEILKSFPNIYAYQGKNLIVDVLYGNPLFFEGEDECP
jgi:predicted ATPase with chaperone activity